MSALYMKPRRRGTQRLKVRNAIEMQEGLAISARSTPRIISLANGEWSDDHEVHIGCAAPFAAFALTRQGWGKPGYSESLWMDWAWVSNTSATAGVD